MSKPRYIVAETAKNWPEEIPSLLSERFEDILACNWERGYKLHSWRLSQFQTKPGQMVETIIAVFELREVL